MPNKTKGKSNERNSKKNVHGDQGKQTMSQSEIKRPVQFIDDEEPNKKKKGSKKSVEYAGASKKEERRPVTAVFSEGGTVMNMEVTDEELRQFDEGEQGSKAEVMDEMYNSEISEDEEPVGPAGSNNNATALATEGSASHCRDMAVKAGTSSDETFAKKKPDESFDVEEKNFMRRFAVFMEQEGYIQKKGTSDTQGGWVTSRQPVKRQLDRNKDIGEEETARVGDDNSEVTVYQRAVAVSTSQAGESVVDPILTSSDEYNNTSDESLNADQLISRLDTVDIVGGKTV